MGGAEHFVSAAEVLVSVLVFVWLVGALIGDRASSELPVARTVVFLAAALTVMQPLGVVAEPGSRIPAKATEVKADGKHEIGPVEFELGLRQTLLSDGSGPEATLRARSTLAGPLLFNSTEIVTACHSDEPGVIAGLCWEPGASKIVEQESPGGEGGTGELREADGVYWLTLTSTAAPERRPAGVKTQDTWRLSFGIASKPGLACWIAGILLLAVAWIRAFRTR